MRWIAIIIGVLLVIAAYVALTGDDGDDSTTAPRALPERRSPITKPLEDQVRLSDLKCGYDEARGKVTNNAVGIAVKVFIDVQFLDSDGVVIGNSLASVSGLRPGETGKWDAPYLGDHHFSKCRADISSVFKH